QYALGLMGMTRRFNEYNFDMGWQPLNVVSTVGAFLMGLAFVFQVWQIAHSIRFMKPETTGDNWQHGRTLEWSIPSPAPFYNFARIPEVVSQDDWWETKQRREKGIPDPAHVIAAKQAPLEPIHMPKNTGIPIIMSSFWFIAGFGFVWDWKWMIVLGIGGVIVTMLVRSFHYNDDYYIPVEEIERIE